MVAVQSAHRRRRGADMFSGWFSGCSPPLVGQPWSVSTAARECQCALKWPHSSPVKCEVTHSAPHLPGFLCSCAIWLGRSCLLFGSCLCLTDATDRVLRKAACWSKFEPCTGASLQKRRGLIRSVGFSRSCSLLYYGIFCFDGSGSLPAPRF